MEKPSNRGNNINWIEIHPVFLSLTTFIVGGFFAFIINYLLIYIRFSEDIAYIKGQLSLLLERSDKIDNIIEDHGKIGLELSAIISRLGMIEKKILHGGYI